MKMFLPLETTAVRQRPSDTRSVAPSVSPISKSIGMCLSSFVFLSNCIAFTSATSWSYFPIVTNNKSLVRTGRFVGELWAGCLLSASSRRHPSQHPQKVGLWVIPVEWIINDGGEREREKEREKERKKKEKKKEKREEES